MGLLRPEGSCAIAKGAPRSDLPDLWVITRSVRRSGRCGATAGRKASTLTARAPTRKGAKKAQPVSLTPEQAARLKAQPDTPQGRRHVLLLCLLLDHGLRVGEVAGLAVRDFDLAAGELRFYRPKVDKIQTHRLTADTLAARLICRRGPLPWATRPRYPRLHRGQPCGPRVRGARCGMPA